MYPVEPHQRTDFEQALADLAIATTDYESAYRAQHGQDGDIGNEEINQARLRAELAVHQAYQRLSDLTGERLAQQIRVALIFTASRTRGERKPNQVSDPDYVRWAVANAWEFRA